jgi:hypothetical protein
MAREGADLVTALPHQPPAGKLEYQVRLAKGPAEGGATALFPPRPAVTRFKGDVPAAVLVPHVLCMFLAMLFSTAAGLAALAGARTRPLALVTFGLVAVGGFLLGPVVQKAAFDAYWTGIPFGWDLTDNKTLFAGLFWAAALLALRAGETSRSARAAVLAASVATLVVFAIPHSTWGSEIKWEGQGAPASSATSRPSS